MGWPKARAQISFGAPRRPTKAVLAVAGAARQAQAAGCDAALAAISRHDVRTDISPSESKSYSW
jgi:hypothetical protein